MTSRLRFIDLESVDSTNRYALEHATEDDICVVTARQQTAGRGRRNRTWVSTDPNNLYLSLGLRGTPDVGSLPQLPVMTGIRCGQALMALGADVRLKWPNDLYQNGRKVGGILVEARVQGSQFRMAIGIGLNIVAPLPADDDNEPGALCWSASAPSARTLVDAIIAALHDEVLGPLHRGEPLGPVQWPSSHDLFHRGQAVTGFRRESQTPIHGTYHGVSPAAELVLKVGDEPGLQHFRADDLITLRARPGLKRPE